MEDSIKEVEKVELDKLGRKKGGRPKGSIDNLVVNRIERTGEAGSGKYVGPDKIAMKKKLTYKEKAFVDEYLQSHNASAAYRASKGTLANPEDWVDSDRPNGMMMKRKEKIKAYLMEKIMTDADECLDIQMDLIRNEKTPAAVRNAAIVDRLNRMGIGKEKEESDEFTGVGEVTITIKHKKPDVIDMSNDLEIIEEDNGKTIQSELGDDGETVGGMAGTDGQED